MDVSFAVAFMDMMKIILVVFIFSQMAIGYCAYEGINELKLKYSKEHLRLTKQMESGEELDADAYPEGLKNLYFQIFESHGEKILEANELESTVEKSRIKFNRFKEILSTLEFKEGEVDKFSEKVETHLKILSGRVYKRSTYFFIDAASWQKEVVLSSPTNRNELLVTNKAACLGGGLGKKNAVYHFFFDGCFLIGQGNVGAEVNNLFYRQSNVDVFGLKTSFGAGKFVSSLGAEAGFKIPLLYTYQKISVPDQTAFPGYAIEDADLFNFMASIYFRWPFSNWFFQTEFSKILNEETTFWSLGFGYKY